MGTIGIGIPDAQNSMIYPPQAGINPRKYLDGQDSSEVQDAYQNLKSDLALDQTK